MGYSITENSIIVTLLAVLWFFFVKPIYKPANGEQWRAIWVRTSLAIAVMYGLAWVMALATRSLLQQVSLSTATFSTAALVMVGVILSSLVAFAWLWQTVITDEKSVLSSALEIVVSVMLANLAVMNAMGELGGAAFKFLVFVVSLVLISKLMEAAKSKWVNHLPDHTKRTWRWVAAGLVVLPFVTSMLALLLLGSAIPAFLSWPLTLLSDAPQLFEEYI